MATSNFQSFLGDISSLLKSIEKDEDAYIKARQEIGKFLSESKNKDKTSMQKLLDFTMALGVMQTSTSELARHAEEILITLNDYSAEIEKN